MPSKSTIDVWLLGSLLIVMGVVQGAQSRTTTQRKKLVPVFYDVAACSDKQHNIQIHNVTYVTDEWGHYYASADVLFEKGMKSVSKFAVLVTKCTGGRAPNLCEYYLRWVWTTALCQLIPSRGMTWTPFHDSFDPPFNCPIQKGYYSVRNATLDVNVLKVMVPDLPKHIWPTEVQLYDENGELIVCLVATVEVRYVKGKGREV